MTIFGNMKIYGDGRRIYGGAGRNSHFSVVKKKTEIPLLKDWTQILGLYWQSKQTDPMIFIPHVLLFIPSFVFFYVKIIYSLSSPHP